MSFSRSYAIDWADEHGKMRVAQLTPTDDPFKTSKRLIQRLIPIKLKEWAEHKYIF